MPDPKDPSNPFLAAMQGDDGMDDEDDHDLMTPGQAAAYEAQQQLAAQQAMAQMTPEQAAVYQQQLAAYQQQMAAIQAAMAQMPPEQAAAYQQQLAAQQAAMAQMTPEQAAAYQQQLAAQQAMAQMTPEQAAAYQQQLAAHQQAAMAAQQQAAQQRAAQQQAPRQPELPPGFDAAEIEKEDFEGDFEARRKKGKQKFWFIAGGVFVVLVLVYIGFGASKIFEAVEEETPETVDMEMGDPNWVELPMMSVEVRTDPPGARVSINGVVAEGVTPAQFQLIEGFPNTVSVFQDGFYPEHQFVPVGVDLSQGLALTLKPVPEPPPLAEGEAPDPLKQPWADVEIRTQNPDDNGATVWLDGKIVGQTPLRERVTRGGYHHAVIVKEGKAPHSVIFRTLQPIYLVEVLLGEGVYVDRLTEVNVEPAPKTAAVQLDDNEPHIGLVALPYHKGKLARISVTAEEYEPWQFSVHTSKIGNFSILPVLDRYRSGPSLVAFKIPEDQYWYPCLNRPGNPVCWEDDPTKTKVVEGGKYELKVWEQMEGHASNRRNAPNRPEITLEPGFSYTIELDFFTEELKFTMPEPVECSPQPCALAPVGTDKADDNAARRRRK